MANTALLIPYARQSLSHSPSPSTPPDKASARGKASEVATSAVAESQKTLKRTAAPFCFTPNNAGRRARASFERLALAHRQRIRAAAPTTVGRPLLRIVSMRCLICGPTYRQYYSRNIEYPAKTSVAALIVSRFPPTRAHFPINQ